MSFLSFPKELRLCVWQLVYFSQEPRLIELRTAPHRNAHDERTFCPRYSPSPELIVFSVCRESRTEAHFQARKAGHIVRLREGLVSGGQDETTCFSHEFYFRFETDILYVPLAGRHVNHYDDSLMNGLLPHFRRAEECDASSLQHIAITKVIESGFQSGGITNSLRAFPNLVCIYLMVPDEVLEQQGQRTLFVRAAQRIMMLHRRDKQIALGKFVPVDAEFARLNHGKLEIVSKDTWKSWSELGNDWVRQKNWSVEMKEAYPEQYD
ncbi:hypothetical protein HBH56_028240 [Parastagonospora nodorum]|uniref:2EXR domain-containing protein n=1 Tax=Phaeosphaeria nodorum (strain SN15 / ATCC MYA-4574 / FGSC 10173) TaxID=321614 RepID=A0A7U2F5H9_PHANO|nr:hypothetical protein HBH56_028240 [Parastagonospora nodorum]QRC99098.1 hypothetical protein JI435_064400 [Parastagonospora nodorum SN15]KAH3934276.1 hypothetical protein HBH54_053800 [Parastagonospora nodorum]KAH3949887.1 hypothetical protein HBH53_081470 [Parastagonospora nodorum]KAH3975870.1 hypothetical protein HBH51_083880 [Parastagonospora nodorum]